MVYSWRWERNYLKMATAWIRCGFKHRCSYGNYSVFCPSVRFFREGRPQLFYSRLLARPTVHRLAKCGWVPVADHCLRSLALNSPPIWSRLWTKVHVVLRRYSRPRVVVNALARLSTGPIMFHSEYRLYTRKCRESCWVAKSSKKVVFGPPISRGRDTPDFGHAFSNCTYFRPCGQFWSSSVQRAWRLEGEIKKKKKNRGKT